MLYLSRKKSFAHTKIQRQIQALIPTAILEKPFPEIGRIADVSWEEKKIVFEVQCSPLSLEEARARCADYEGIGFTSIWILYTKKFNGRDLSPAEQFLRQKICFFSDGHNLYDQPEVILNGKKISHGKPLSVNLTEVLRPLPKAPSLYTALLSHFLKKITT